MKKLLVGMTLLASMFSFASEELYVVSGGQDLSVEFTSPDAFKSHRLDLGTKLDIQDENILNELSQEEYEEMLAKAIYRAKNTQLNCGYNTICPQEDADLSFKNLKDKAVLELLENDLEFPLHQQY